MGGGATIGSALDAGLVDALTLHLAPVVLGVGTPLWPRPRARRHHNPDIGCGMQIIDSVPAGPEYLPLGALCRAAAVLVGRAVPPA